MKITVSHVNAIKEERINQLVLVSLCHWPLQCLHNGLWILQPWWQSGGYAWAQLYVLLVKADLATTATKYQTFQQQRLTPSPRFNTLLSRVQLGTWWQVDYSGLPLPQDGHLFMLLKLRYIMDTISLTSNKTQALTELFIHHLHRICNITLP